VLNSCFGIISAAQQMRVERPGFQLRAQPSLVVTCVVFALRTSD